MLRNDTHAARMDLEHDKEYQANKKRDEEAPHLKTVQTCISCKHLEWIGMTMRCSKFNRKAKDNHICDAHQEDK